MRAVFFVAVGLFISFTGMTWWAMNDMKKMSKSNGSQSGPEVVPLDQTNNTPQSGQDQSTSNQMPSSGQPAGGDPNAASGQPQAQSSYDAQSYQSQSSSSQGYQVPSSDASDYQAQEAARLAEQAAADSSVGDAPPNSGSYQGAAGK